MKAFGWHFALAFAWVALTGRLELWNIGVGLALGLIILALAGRLTGRRAYGGRLHKAAVLTVIFLVDLLLANLRLAADVITPKSRLRPSLVRVPLNVTSDAEITLLANLITLTPGTTTISVAPDRSELLMHTLYLDRAGPDAEISRLKNGLERRIMEVTR